MYVKYMFLSLYFAGSSLATIFRDDTSFSASFSNVYQSKSLDNSFKHFNVTMLQYCLMGCIQCKSCKSVNYQSSLNICELNSKSLEDGVSLIDRDKWIYIESVNYETFCKERNPCKHDGLCKHSQLYYTCICSEGYVGQNCEFIKIEHFAIDFKKQITTGILYKEIIFDEGLSEASICYWLYPRSKEAQFSVNVYGISSCNAFVAGSYNHQYLFAVDDKSIVGDGFITNKWQHFCGTWAYNGEMVAYIDGEKSKSITSTGEAAKKKQTGRARVNLGQDTDPVNGRCKYSQIEQSLLGKISQFYMWNRALTETEVKTIYKMTIIPSNGILVNWRYFKGKADGLNHVEVPFKM